MDRDQLSRLPQYVTVTTVTLLGMLLAVLLANLTGGGETSKLFLIMFGVTALAAIIAMNRHIWLLIPATWLLIGRIQVLPVPFSVRDLVVLTVVGTVLVLMALKYFRSKPKYGWLDVLVFLNVAYLATCFARNPIGVVALNSQMIGGRPYFDVAIGLLAYWVLVRMRVNVTTSRAIPSLILFFTGSIAFLTLLSLAFPGIVPKVSPFYSGIDPTAYNAEDVTYQGSGTLRLGGLQQFGIYGGIALCAYFTPITLLLPTKFWRLLAFVIVSLALLFSGFRSAVLFFGAMFLLGSYFRNGWRHVLPLGAIGAVVLTILVTGQGRVYDLPFAAQRALSFLPGNWSTAALDSGRGSAEWRFEMWRIALTTDGLIRNKLLGDGFGFTRLEYDYLQQSKSLVQTNEQTREVAMIAGDYHSGPVSTLKTVGVPGLVLFYLLLFSLAKMAVQQIRRARETPLFPFALFIGMPILFEPFFYTFIFGGYNNALPNALFGVGLLKMLEASMDERLAQNQGPAAIPASPPRGAPSSSRWAPPDFPSAKPKAVHP